MIDRFEFNVKHSGKISDCGFSMSDFTLRRDFILARSPAAKTSANVVLQKKSEMEHPNGAALLNTIEDKQL